MQSFRTKNIVAAIFCLAITIVANADPPQVSVNTINILEDQTYVFSIGDFPFSDIDSDPLDSVIIFDLPSSGGLYLSGILQTDTIKIDTTQIKNLSFVPSTNEFGTPYATYSVKVIAGGERSTNTDVHTVNVTAVNDSPTSTNINFAFDEDGSFTFTLTDFPFSDVESSSLSGIRIASLPANGSLIYNSSPAAVDQEIAAGNIGLLVFSPAQNGNGSPYSAFNFEVYDGTDYSTSEYTCTFNVNPVNDLPAIDPISDVVINEDNGEYTVNLQGISAGPSDETGQVISISATSNNTSLIPDPTIIYTSPSTTGELKFTPVADQFGTTNISIIVSDNGGGDDTLIVSFQVDVQSVNDAPTLNALPSPLTINEDAGVQTVNLSGITAGGGENQILAVSAISSDTSIVKNFTINYTSPNPIGSINFSPQSNSFGSTTISVTVDDGAATDNLITRSFVLNVNPVNDPPTFDNISSPINIQEDSPEQNISITGISPGPKEAENVTFDVSTDNSTLITGLAVNYSSGSTGTLVFTPAADVFGSVQITLTVTDTASINNSFTQVIDVNVINVNDPPFFDAIASPLNIVEDDPEQIVVISGISPGPNESEVVDFSVSSDNPALITGLAVNYSGGTSANLLFTPAENLSGSGVVTVQVNDNQVSNNTFSRQFTVNVIAVNDPPTINPTADVDNVLEDAGNFVVNLSGISAGPNESQTVSVSASTNNPTLIPSISVNYSQGSPTGSLTLTTGPNQNGTAEIVVLVDDGQVMDSEVRDTFEVSVIPVNDAPTFQFNTSDPNIIAVLEDAPPYNQLLVISKDDGDADDDQDLTFSTRITSIDPNLSFTSLPRINDATGNLQFELSSNANGQANVEVKLTDNGGTFNGGIDSSKQSIIIVATAVNDKPSFTLNGNPPEINEDQGPINVPSFAQNIDDGDPELNQTLSFQVNLDSKDATLSFASNPAISVATGELTYEANPNTYGTAIYNVTLSDNGGQVSDVLSFTVTVNEVNDPPVGANGSSSTNEDTPLNFNSSLFTFSDLDNHGFAGIQIISTPVNGTLLYDGSEATINQICPNVNLLQFLPVADEFGSPYTTFDFKVRDNSGDVSIENYTFTINVNPVDDNPLGADNNIVMPEDGTYIFSAADFPFTDVDNHSFNGIRLNTGVALGTLLASGNPLSNGQVINNVTTITYQPGPSGFGSPYTTFTFRVIDSQNAESDEIYTLTINVGPEKDPPTGDNESISVLEDSVYAFSTDDFTFDDLDDDLFDGIRVIDVESNGVLLYDGFDVVALQDCQDVTLLTFSSTLNDNGIPYATFTFKVRDNSGAANLSLADYTMTISVPAVNDRPVFTITENPPTINEDDGSQVVTSFASSIDDGDPELNQALTFNLTPTVVTGNINFSSGPTIDVASGDLSYAVSANTYGQANVDVSLVDNGGTADGGQNTSTISTFAIVVNSINDQPTINAIPDLIIDEDVGLQTVNLSGISAGPLEDQTLTISVTSNNTNVIPHPTLNYTQGSSTGNLQFTPVSNAFGTAIITVEINDGGSSNNIVTTSFTVQVNAVNDPPTVDAVSNPPVVEEDAPIQVFSLTGISEGPLESQSVSLNISTDNPGLFDTLVIDYTYPNSEALLYFEPAENDYGVANITIELDDGQATNNLTELNFPITISPVNDQPFFNEPVYVSVINEDTSAFTIEITGIDPGPNESLQEIIVSAISTEGLMVIDNVEYVGGPTAQIIVFPIANINGEDTLIVTINDQQDANNTFRRELPISIKPVNDPPSFQLELSEVMLDENFSPEVSIKIIPDKIPFNEESEIIFYTIDPPSLDFVDVLVDNDSLLIRLNSIKNLSGNANVTVIANDGREENNLFTQNLQINVRSVNNAPEFTVEGEFDFNEDFAESDTIRVVPGEVPADEIDQVVTYELLPGSVDFVNLSFDTQVGTLVVSSIANEYGSQQFEIIANDGQNENNLHSENFILTVNPINDAPTINPISDTVVIESGAEFLDVTISGISAGPNENQQLSMSASSLDLDILPNPTVEYQNPESFGVIRLVPNPSNSGDVKVLVTVTDNGPSSVPNVNDSTIELNVFVQGLPISSIEVDVTEDEPFSFNSTLFENAFNNELDTLVEVKIITTPEFGRLSLQPQNINIGIAAVLSLDELNSLVYFPDANNEFDDRFTWKGSNGKNFSTFDGTVNLDLIPVNDPPFIEPVDNRITFGFGEERLPVFPDIVITDVDNDVNNRKIDQLVLQFEDFVDEEEDSIFFPIIQDARINYFDSTGRITVNAFDDLSVYQDLLRDLDYINKNRFTPNIKSRKIAFYLIDNQDLTSNTRRVEIQFFDTFIELDIPSGFTPNNDGDNDTWNIQEIERYPESVVSVYSKDGSLVFSSTGYEQEWDGTYKGVTLAAGTYYYTITISTYDKKYSGPITILK